MIQNNYCIEAITDTYCSTFSVLFSVTKVQMPAMTASLRALSMMLNDTKRKDICHLLHW